jgi:transposase-like protein
MNDLINLLKGVAPALATAVAGPLGGAAVSAIASKLGVESSVQAVAQAIAGDPEAAQKLAEIDLKKFQMHNENTANARAMQIAALQQEDTFSKRFLMYFAIGWSLCAIIYIGCITFGNIPQANIRFADTILGFVLGTIVSTILNFFFGSAHGSSDKQETIKEVLHSKLEHDK